jgi:hypothetical protein
LADPVGLLQGTGKLGRHVKLRLDTLSDWRCRSKETKRDARTEDSHP